MNEADTFVGARIPAELHAAVCELARKNERTFSAELRLALKRHVGGKTPAEKAEEEAMRRRARQMGGLERRDGVIGLDGRYGRDATAATFDNDRGTSE